MNLHPHTLIRAWNARQEAARDAYDLENHCQHCGAFVQPIVRRDLQRTCKTCKEKK